MKVKDRSLINAYLLGEKIEEKCSEKEEKEDLEEL